VTRQAHGAAPSRRHPARSRRAHPCQGVTGRARRRAKRTAPLPLPVTLRAVAGPTLPRRHGPRAPTRQAHGAASCSRHPCAQSQGPPLPRRHARARRRAKRTAPLPLPVTLRAVAGPTSAGASLTTRATYGSRLRYRRAKPAAPRQTWALRLRAG